MAFFKPKPDKPSLTMLLGDSFWRMDEVDDTERLFQGGHKTTRDGDERSRQSGSSSVSQ